MGYVDDHGKTSPGLGIRSVTWEQASAIGYDTVLIGSFYWADQLRVKAAARIPVNRIVPYTRTEPCRRSYSTGILTANRPLG